MEIFLDILKLFGIPTLLLAAVLGLFGTLKTQVSAVKLGIQALLRADMVEAYNKYSEKGYAPIYARESFEAAYQQYHKLGANGVMDDIRQKFLALPTQYPDKERRSD